MALAVFLSLPLPALAVPALQLYIPGATFDTLTQTWVTNQKDFSLYVAGTSQSKYSVIEDVTLIIALFPGETGAEVGITNSAGDYTLINTFPNEGTPPGIPPGGGGIYKTSTPYATYSVRDLLVGSAGDTVPDYQPGQTGSATGDIEILTVENLGSSYLHFDLTGIGVGKKGSKPLFAPFSHNAEPVPPVPEPGAQWLLGLGLAAIGAGLWRQRKRLRGDERAS